jgi:phage tail-like protein
MQIPEAIASVSLTLKGTQREESPTNTLLLRPGEPGDIAMQLQNLHDHPLQWELEVKGDFPAQWCFWEPETSNLEPEQACDRAIRFQVPADFFEHLLAVSPGKPRLKLNYQSQISVYANWGTQRQLIGYQVFNLEVRPASPYLNFLPALYREVDLVGRFSAIFEQAFDPAVQTLDSLWAYLDPLTAPEALLPFLAHWVAWSLDDRWTLKQQRRLIRNAITLYRWHGTRQGLRFYLHLYTGLPLDEHIAAEADKHISIEEVFSAGFLMGKTHVGEDSMLGGGRPYHFIVKLRSQPDDRIDETLVREIIERQKPAFCTYELQILPN